MDSISSIQSTIIKNYKEESLLNDKEITMLNIKKNKLKGDLKISNRKLSINRKLTKYSVTISFGLGVLVTVLLND